MNDVASEMSGAKISLLAFGDSRMVDARRRLEKQAEAMGVYDRMDIYDENGLGKEFRERFAKILVFGTRGYGYWCWKPYLVKTALESAEYGDIVNYVDMGCHLNPAGIARFREYVDMTLNHPSGMLVFRKNEPEYRLTKGDLLDYFNVRANAEITQSGQITATAFLIRKTPETVELAEKWLRVYETRFELVDDSRSKSENLPGFFENKHDQSVFSLLAKLHGALVIPGNELTPGGKPAGKKGWETVASYPLLQRKDRGLKRSMGRNAVRLCIRLACMLIPHRETRKKVRNRLMAPWMGY